MYPVLQYVVVPTLPELARRVCLMHRCCTARAATLLSFLVPPAIRETLWMFTTIAIRLGPFRPHGSVLVDGAQLLRDATDTLCNPTLLAIADYRGTRHMAQLPDTLCLAQTSLDRIGFLAGLVSALLETPSLGDLALTVLSSYYLALALDHVLSSAIRHWAKHYFGIYALEEQLHKKVAIQRALDRQVADATLTLKHARDRLAKVDRDVSRAEELARELDDAKSELRAAQELEHSEQRDAEDARRQVELWRNRAIKVVEDAKVELTDATAQASQAQEHRQAARTSVDNQLASVMQASDTTKATTNALRMDYTTLVRSARRTADQPFTHPQLDQSTLISLLFAAFDKHKENAEVQAALAQQHQGCGGDTELERDKEQDALSNRFVTARDDNERAQKELDARGLRLEQRRAKYQDDLGPLSSQLDSNLATLKKINKDLKTVRGEEIKWKEATKSAEAAHQAQLKLAQASRATLLETAEQHNAEIASLKQAWETREQEHATDMQAIQRTHNAHLERLRSQHTKNAEQLLFCPAQTELVANTVETDSVSTMSRKPLRDVQNQGAAKQRKTAGGAKASGRALVDENS